MERTSQTVQTSGEREHGGAQSATNKVGGVSTDVATLVVGVDGQVKTHELNEVVVVAVAELVGQVVGVILVLLDRSDLAILEDVAVDLGSDGGQLGNEVHGVLEGVVPVVLLVDTLGIGLGEGRLVLKSGDGQRELGHGVEGAGAAVDELLNELGEVGAGSPLSRQVADLLLSRDLASQEEPEETLRKRLLTTGSLGEELLALGDLKYCQYKFRIVLRLFATYGTATETDTLLRVEDGTLSKSVRQSPQNLLTRSSSYLPHEALNTTGTTIGLVKSDLADDLAAVLPTNID